MAMNTDKRNRGGFTIINVLVGIVLLVAGVMALGKSNAETLRGQSLAQNRTNALAIARAYLEEVRTRDPWSLATESPMMVGGDGVPTSLGKFKRQMTVIEERNNLVRLEVEVDFPRAMEPVRVTTYQYRGNALAGGA
jgi:type IV pilus assembly protein PilV